MEGKGKELVPLLSNSHLELSLKKWICSPFLPHLWSFSVFGFSCSPEEDGLISSGPRHTGPGLQEGCNDFMTATGMKKIESLSSRSTS